MNARIKVESSFNTITLSASQTYDSFVFLFFDVEVKHLRKTFYNTLMEFWPLSPDITKETSQTEAFASRSRFVIATQ